MPAKIPTNLNLTLPIKLDHRNFHWQHTGVYDAAFAEACVLAATMGAMRTAQGPQVV